MKVISEPGTLKVEAGGLGDQASLDYIVRPT